MKKKISKSILSFSVFIAISIFLISFPFILSRLFSAYFFVHANSGIQSTPITNSVANNNSTNIREEKIKETASTLVTERTNNLNSLISYINSSNLLNDDTTMTSPLISQLQSDITNLEALNNKIQSLSVSDNSEIDNSLLPLVKNIVTDYYINEIEIPKIHMLYRIDFLNNSSNIFNSNATNMSDIIMYLKTENTTSTIKSNAADILILNNDLEKYNNDLTTFDTDLINLTGDVNTIQFTNSGNRNFSNIQSLFSKNNNDIMSLRNDIGKFRTDFSTYFYN